MNKSTGIVIAIAIGVLAVAAYVVGIEEVGTVPGIVEAPSYPTVEGKPAYLSNLPQKPDDWDIMMREANSGYIDFTKMNPAYWKQPDFYQTKIAGTNKTTWDIAKVCYESHDYRYWGVYGHGAFPADPEFVFESREAGSWLSENIIYRTGYCLETWQGIRLTPSQSEYFTVTLSPNIMLLEPTFPKILYNWSFLMNVKVAIKKPPPSGTYEIPVEVDSPPRERSKEWFWEVLRKETTPEQQWMITEARKQAEETGRMPSEFERWITVERKNKYVESSPFQMNPPIVVKITVR